MSTSIRSTGCGTNICISSSRRRRRRRPVQGRGSGKCRRQSALFGREQIDAPAREEACRRLADPVPNRAIEVRARQRQQRRAVVRLLAEVHLTELRLELRLSRIRVHRRLARRGVRGRVERVRV